MSSRLSVVIVTYNSRDDVRRGLGRLVAQLAPGDELIVVDNASSDGTADAVRAVAPEARLLEMPTNVGFASGCNAAAAVAAGDLLLLLNPDAVVQDGFVEAIRRPLTAGYGWDAWQGVVTEPGGALINTVGNAVHFTGLSWAGSAGAPVAAAPHAPVEVAGVSGACMAVRADIWRRLGGFPERFFMYSEDLDLSLRIRLAGGRLGIEPSARVEHHYEFHKGGDKWRRMERNRWFTVLRTYPAPVLAAALPVMLAAELPILVAAARGGWAGAKLRAARETLRGLPRTWRERGTIQARRHASPEEFARWLTPELDSSYLGAVARSPLVCGPLRAYWRLARLAIAGLR